MLYIYEVKSVKIDKLKIIENSLEHSENFYFLNLRVLLYHYEKFGRVIKVMFTPTREQLFKIESLYTYITDIRVCIRILSKSVLSLLIHL